MNRIEIYSGDSCPYCVRAKQLLERRNLNYIEYNVTHDASKRAEMVARVPGARTIPQIFINNRHVGGCDELHAIDRRGELSAWLTSGVAQGA